MTGIRKIQHAQLRVEDLGTAVDFYTHVMGLVELDRRDGVVYLGTGVDQHFDLAVREGGTGVDHFAVRAGSTDEIDSYEAALDQHGADWQRGGGTERGHDQRLGFELPSGTRMEFQVAERETYTHTTIDGSAADVCGPTDLDHITLATRSPKTDASFLRDVLGWKISDAVRDGSGDWALAFTRQGDYHHDVGFLKTDNEDWNLFHLAWTFQSFDHMKLFADKLARHGQYLEMGMNRHYYGDNLFAYFSEPGGNRFELSAEMATVDQSTPTAYHDTGERENAIAAWGGCAFPESMLEGQ